MKNTFTNKYNKKTFYNDYLLGDLILPKNNKSYVLKSVENIIRIAFYSNVNIKFNYIPYLLYIIDKNCIRNGFNIQFNSNYIQKNNRLYLEHNLSRNLFNNKISYIDENDCIKIHSDVKELQLWNCSNYLDNYIKTILIDFIKNFNCLDDYISFYNSNNEFKTYGSNYNGFIYFEDFISEEDNRFEIYTQQIDSLDYKEYLREQLLYNHFLYLSDLKIKKAVY